MTPELLEQVLDELAKKVAEHLRPAAPPQLLLVDEVAAVLRRSPQTIQDWIAQGYLAARRDVGGRFLIRRVDLDAHLAGLPAGSKKPRRGSKAARLVGVPGGVR